MVNRNRPSKKRKFRTMKTQLFQAFAVVTMFFGVACIGNEPDTQDGQGGQIATSGAGGQGGSASSSTSGQGGAAGAGGDIPTIHTYHSPELTGIPCAYDDDCAQVGHDLCEVAACNEGQCVRAMAPLGLQCSANGSDICDGRGNCGQWMPYAAQCYSAAPLSYSECPTCDDADPATKDACENIGGLMQCTHAPLPEGHYCGPWYTIQDGKCCFNGVAP